MQKNRNWAALIGLPVVGAVIALLVQQYFFPYNVKLQQKAELKRELVKEQYPNLQKAKRLARLGLSITEVVFQTSYVDSRTKRRISRDTTIGMVRIPSVAHDLSARKEWTRLLNETKDAGYLLDQRVLQVIVELEELVKRTPWPKSKEFEDYQKSQWAMPNFIDHWISVNQRLDQEVDQVFSLEE
jgi:hypothetical protein